LKRLALIWAQAQGYSACAAEVTLPSCRYRADVAAYRPQGRRRECTAIFECKQTLPDLQRDNCVSAEARARLAELLARRVILEKHLRIHYPHLRLGDSLFPEFESYHFEAIGHRGYRRVVRECSSLQQQLHAGTKFETLVRYRCADVYYLVLPDHLDRKVRAPHAWGVLTERCNGLELTRKPALHEATPDQRRRFLERIAAAGTRQFNRTFEITFEEVTNARQLAA